MIQRILLFEPQCRDFEHATFNAAFITMAAHAFPAAELTFVSEPGHAERIRRTMTGAGEKFEDRLTFETVEPPPRGVEGRARLPFEKEMVADLIERIYRHKPDFVIVTSLTGPFLVRLKIALWRGMVPACPILAVPHAILNSLGMGWTPTLREKIVSFPAALRYPAPRRLRYLAFGEGIMRELERRAPRASRRFLSIDPAYFTRPVTIDDNPAPIRFCYVGGGYKLFSEFVNIARELHDDSGKTELTLAGFISDPADLEKAKDIVSGIGAEPLDASQMSERIEACTYAIGMCKPIINRLTTSASLLDALAHGKPGIYIRTPFIGSWFERLGDIGYLCDSPDEIRETIAGIQREFPRERYRRQCENILKGRDAIDPINVARRFKEAVGRAYGPTLLENTNAKPIPQSRVIDPTYHPRVSIVLPTYNGSKYLRESIDSILAQTERDFELIIVNDASTDDTQVIIDDYARLDGRIRPILNEKNKKLPASLNVGFRAARGRLLTWTSDDNQYRPDAIKHMADFLDARPDIGVVYCDFTLIDPEGKPIERETVGEPPALLTGNVVRACFMYRREVDEALHGYDETLFLVEDYDFWLRAAEQFKLATLHEDLYLIRSHGGSLTETRRLEIRKMTEARLEHHINSCRQRWTRRHRAAGWAGLAQSAQMRGDLAASGRYFRRALIECPGTAMKLAPARVIANGLVGQAPTMFLRRLYAFLRGKR